MVEDCRQPRPAIAPRIAFMITGTGVHDRPESAFKINWNARSRSTGFGVHDPPERAHITWAPPSLSAIGGQT
jgi:hypothetical protein